MEGLNWFSFTKTAFSRSRREKKPVLLYLSAVWCHWCHTMDRLAYSDEKITDFINKNFIPVKVDTDKRPDINERYNVGGWPSTVILASDGELISAATYVAPENMVKFLEDALKRFKKYKPKKKRVRKEVPVEFDSGQFFDAVKCYYDPVNGGFGLEPKFLNSDVLEYLIWRRDAYSHRMLDFTCSKMLYSQVFDRVWGGFFRYATEQNWEFPHFEKMLEDNAKMLSVYLWAYKLFKKEDYLTAANKILFFLFTVLYDHEKNLFYNSQDADEKYCRMDFEERRKAVQPVVDKTIYTDSNSAVALALFDAGLEHYDVAFKVLESLYKLNVRGLVAHYYPSEQPLYLLKDHVYFLAALVHAFKVTNRLEWRAKALSVAKALEKFYDRKNGGFFDVLPAGVGRLKDRKKPVHENAFAALVLKELSKIAGEPRYLKMAEKTLQAVSFQALALGPFAATYAIAVEELKS
ncbi:Thiol:disulfide interchange protein DsbD [uncultured archaeon]|nr:Thiol:disulfide interchange protein DsbD [uncultured archaeon]